MFNNALRAVAVEVFWAEKNSCSLKYIGNPVESLAEQKVFKDPRHLYARYLVTASAVSALGSLLTVSAPKKSACLEGAQQDREGDAVRGVQVSVSGEALPWVSVSWRLPCRRACCECKGASPAVGLQKSLL